MKISKKLLKFFHYSVGVRVITLNNWASNDSITYFYQDLITDPIFDSQHVVLLVHFKTWQLRVMTKINEIILHHSASLTTPSEYK